MRPASGSSSAAYVLEALQGKFIETVTAAQTLMRRGVGPSKARAVVERLLAGDRVALPVPALDSADLFENELRILGIRAQRRQAPATVDVAAIRQRLGLTQEEFAARFALSVANIRNWEQGRSQPDDAARAFLTVIEKAPAVADEAVSA
jgi:DNA-binding transcriptional regulator YiaG